jgi:hypothetical protein
MTTGPITAALEAEVRDKIQRSHIIVWLDTAGHYTPFVDALAARHVAADFPYPVVAFRGSFLETLFALEPFGDSVEKPHLLVHVPGHNKLTIRKTPLLEIYEAGTGYERALDTLVREVATGRVPPEEIERHLAIPARSLAGAETWLAEQTAGGRDAFTRTLEAMDLAPLVEGLVGRGGREGEPSELAALGAHLNRQVGMDEAWIQWVLGGRGARNRDELGVALGAWLLCVEYVNDLERQPHLQALARLHRGSLSKPLVARCTDLTRGLRERGDLYERLADEVQALLREERDAVAPEDLGRIDTFRFEEARVLEGALEALQQGQWDKAQGFATAREGDKSFWLVRDPMRRQAWTIAGDAARFGAVMAAAPRPLHGARSLADGVQRYTQGGARVDRAHRHFEQTWQRLWDPRVPHLEALKEIRRKLQRLYRTWADRLASDFSALCMQHGFLPGAELQQRNIFEHVVLPLTLGADKVAYFVIDAFRYEMATELCEEITGPGAIVDLGSRLAELPTITSVGMNVLAPVVASGRLWPALESGSFGGFRNGEYTIKTPDDRARAMGERSGVQVLLLTLAEVCETENTALKRRIAQAKLILVHSKEIDEAGEVGVGIRTFASTLRDIKAAWHHLQGAGVKQFVFTADHGFLLQDETTREHPYGKRTDPSRRHVFAEEQRREAGTTCVPLTELGYDRAPGYLLFREDTTTYATGTKGATFVHGGNSPEERIIPVLTVRRKSEAAGGTSPYLVEATAERDLAGMRCIRLRVVLVPGSSFSLGFAAVSEIEIGLRVPERPDVELTIKDVRNPGTVRNGRIAAKVGEEWIDVYFALEGPIDDKVRVEAFHPLGVQRVTPITPVALFAVDGRHGRTQPPNIPYAMVTARPAGAWQASLPDDATRRVFLHIDEHGALTEEELVGMVGSPRAARRFAAEFDTFVGRVPYRIHIEQTGTGKRYVKDREK